MFQIHFVLFEGFRAVRMWAALGEWQSLAEMRSRLNIRFFFPLTLCETIWAMETCWFPWGVTPRENPQLECYRNALCCPCCCSRCRPGPVPCSRRALPVHDQFRGQGNQQTGIRTARNSQVRDTWVLPDLQSCWNPKVSCFGKPLLDVGRSKTGGYGAWKEMISKMSLPTHTSLWFQDIVNFC